MNARPPFTVQWLSPDREAEWDAFVGHHDLGLVYHLSAWKRMLEDAFFPHQRSLSDLERKHIGRNSCWPASLSGKELVARKPQSSAFLLASFCNPLVSSDWQLNLLLPEVVEEYRRNKCDELEIRMTEETQQLSHPLLSRAARYKHHFLRLRVIPDEMFASLAKTSVCQKVIKARKAGVVIEEVGDERA